MGLVKALGNKMPDFVVSLPGLHSERVRLQFTEIQGHQVLVIQCLWPFFVG
jgi:hypothetical protein